MDENKRAQLQAIIEEEIAVVGGEIENLEELVKPVAPDSALGKLSRMDAIRTQNMNKATLNLAKAKLTKLKNALENIDDPDFGSCSNCGESIPLERLKLMPESTLCVACAEKET